MLRNRPDINRDSLIGLIGDKKRLVGGGYLTDQGALFLVAGELGVKLNRSENSDLGLKHVQLGVNDITVAARVLAIYPIAEFHRKDGAAGRYRWVVLFDSSGTARLTIWDDNEEALKLAGVSVDTPVRVVSAYVKPDRDNKPNMNLGKRGKIEIVSDNAVAAKLLSLSSASKTIGEVDFENVPPAVEGVVVTDSRTSTFVRDDGSGGSLTQFDIGDKSGKRVRVVVWNGNALTPVTSGMRLRITNLRGRKGRQGEQELHGDGATVVQVLDLENPEPAPRAVKIADAKKSTGRLELEVMALSKASLREVNLKDGSIVKKAEVVVGDATGEITMIGWEESSQIIGEIEVGERLRVRDVTIQKSKMGVETLELGPGSTIERVGAG